MAYLAATIHHNQGKEFADCPQEFPTLEQALAFTQATPVSADRNRPWIRNLETGQFALIGGVLK